MRVRSETNRNSRRRNSYRRAFTGISWDSSMRVNSASTNLVTPDDFLPYQVFVLSAYFGHELQKLYREYGLALNEWRTLQSIAGGAANTAIDIVCRVHLDEVTVHRAVKSLIRRGLVERRGNGQDRRFKPLAVTAKGKTVYRNIMPRARGFEQWILDKLPPRDRKVLVRVIRCLFERLELGRPK